MTPLEPNYLKMSAVTQNNRRAKLAYNVDGYNSGVEVDGKALEPNVGAKTLRKGLDTETSGP